MHMHAIKKEQIAAALAFEIDMSPSEAKYILPAFLCLVLRSQSYPVCKKIKVI